MSSPLTDQLKELKAEVLSTKEDRNRLQRLAQKEWSVTTEETRPLSDYRDDVTYQRRDADPDEARKLTLDLFERIRADEDLVLESYGGGRGLLIVRSLARQREFRDSLAAHNLAKGALQTFLRENADALEREREAADAERFKNALDSGDVATVRQIVNDSPVRETPTRRKRVTVPA